MPDFNLEFDMCIIFCKNIENWKSQNDLDEFWVCKKMMKGLETFETQIAKVYRCKDDLLHYFSWEKLVWLDHFW